MSPRYSATPAESDFFAWKNSGNVQVAWRTWHGQARAGMNSPCYSATPDEAGFVAWRTSLTVISRVARDNRTPSQAIRKEAFVPFIQIFYHLVWATKNRQPLLSPALEPVVHGYLRSKATGLGGVVLALNGTEDHVHMVVSVPPSIALATFIGQVKAVASTRVNRTRPEMLFLWQSEYGAFSFDAQRLPNFVAYVERQKQHHAENRTIPVLECCEVRQSAKVRDDSSPYITDDAAWRRELERREPDQAKNEFPST